MKFKAGDTVYALSRCGMRIGRFTVDTALGGGVYEVHAPSGIHHRFTEGMLAATAEEQLERAVEEIRRNSAGVLGERPEGGETASML